MIRNISKVFLQTGAELRHPPAVQSAHRLEQRLRCVLQRRELLLDAIERFDARSFGLLGKDAIFDLFQLRLDGIKHGKVAVHHRVHQRIQHVSRTVTQQLRFLFAALAHVDKPLLRPVSHRENVIAADKDAHFADVQFLTAAFEHMQDDEKRLAVLVDFRPLMAVLRVLDGEVVQTEFLLHRFELPGNRIFNGHPNEAAGLVDEQVNLADRNIIQFFSVPVGDAVDQHGASLMVESLILLCLTLFNIRELDHVPLAAVPVHPLAFARIVDDILCQSLSDHETNQRLRAVVHRFMRQAASGKPDEVTGTDFLFSLAHDFRTRPRQYVDRLFLIPMRMKFRRLVSGRDGDQMYSEILKSNLITQRLIDPNRCRI